MIWLNSSFLPPASEGWGFSLFTLGGGGVPRPRSGVGGGVPCPRSGWWGGYPGQVWGGGGTQPGLDGGGAPQPGLDGGGGTPARSGWWGGYPSQVWMVGGGYLGYPPGQVWMVVGGVPRVTPTPIRQSSIASTCYTVGGMPLAFTQEDFLVELNFISIFFTGTRKVN